MFFGAFVSKTELDCAEMRIADLTAEVERQKLAIKALRQQAKDALATDVATSSFSVDFEEMNAFSIERMEKNGGVITVIGHSADQTTWDTSGNATTVTDVKEWSLYCSHDEHEKLVAEFNAYKKAKGKK